jgi:uncharacterized membrane protein
MNHTPTTSRARLDSIDVVRGVIMILMALDHTRDFFGMPGQNPTNLAQASAALFLTRWITHFCAPVFFLLTGTGACLSLRRQSPGELSQFLVTRGLWLIFLELVLARCLVYQFNVDYQVTMLLVLWALGWAMITLSVLVHIPAGVATAFGVVLVLGHNLFDAVRAGPSGRSFTLRCHPERPGTCRVRVLPADPLDWRHRRGVWPRPDLRLGAPRRRGFLLRLGLSLCLAFVVIRGVNGYGDPAHWTQHQTAALTTLSFLNTTKYPPSLLFLLMTLGPALLLLRAFDHETPRSVRPALVFGRVPLFYYLLHFLLIHLLAVATCYLRFGSAHWMFESPDLAHYPFSAPPGWGYPLPIVYGIWALVVATAYPFCAGFSALKQRRTNRWLGYL